MKSDCPDCYHLPYLPRNEVSLGRKRFVCPHYFIAVCFPFYASLLSCIKMRKMLKGHGHMWKLFRSLWHTWGNALSQSIQKMSDCVPGDCVNRPPSLCRGHISEFINISCHSHRVNRPLVSVRELFPLSQKGLSVILFWLCSWDKVPLLLSKWL